MACGALVQEAYKRGSEERNQMTFKVISSHFESFRVISMEDNLTVIFVRFRWPFDLQGGDYDEARHRLSDASPALRLHYQLVIQLRKHWCRPTRLRVAPQLQPAERGVKKQQPM